MSADEPKPARTCETLKDAPAYLRWLEQVCGAPAIGTVTSPDGHTHRVCERCCTEFETANQKMSAMNSQLRGMPPVTLYEVTRWPK